MPAKTSIEAFLAGITVVNPKTGLAVDALNNFPGLMDLLKQQDPSLREFLWQTIEDEEVYSYREYVCNRYPANQALAMLNISPAKRVKEYDRVVEMWKKNKGIICAKRDLKKAKEAWRLMANLAC